MRAKWPEFNNLEGRLMTLTTYTTLEDFSVEIIKNNGKSKTKIDFKVGEKPFIYDSKKIYKPTVDELIRAGKIQEKAEEKNNLEPSKNNEQSNATEHQSAKPFYFPFRGKADAKEERGNSMKNNQELLRLIEDLMEDKLNDKFGELYNGCQVLTEQNQEVKRESWQTS